MFFKNKKSNQIKNNKYGVYHIIEEKNLSFHLCSVYVFQLLEYSGTIFLWSSYYSFQDHEILLQVHLDGPEPSLRTSSFQDLFSHALLWHIPFMNWSHILLNHRQLFSLSLLFVWHLYRTPKTIIHFECPSLTTRNRCMPHFVAVPERG